MIEIYSLDGCPFSLKALTILDKFDIKYKVVPVRYIDKDKYKKMNKMGTFPQIFTVKNGKKVKLGGADDLEHLIEIVHLMKYNEISINKVREFYKLYDL